MRKHLSWCNQERALTQVTHSSKIRVQTKNGNTTVDTLLQLQGATMSGSVDSTEDPKPNQDGHVL